MSIADAKVALDVKAELGEGPLWDPAGDCLYFVDILPGRVHRYHPATGAARAYQLDQSVSAIALSETGALVLALRDGFGRLDPSAGRVQMIADIEKDRPDQRMNDGACDPAGRFWAGTMALDQRPGAGALYRLDPDGRVHTMLRDVTISNGIDWTADGRRMYYVDSGARSIDVFDFELETGCISNRRTFARVAPADGVPDGLTLDADEFVWLALWGGGALRRYAPDGSVDAVIRLPVTHPTSCAFGGPDLRDLYVTTAWTALSTAERQKQPHAGALFCCRPGARGRPPHRFRG